MTTRSLDQQQLIGADYHYNLARRRNFVLAEVKSLLGVEYDRRCPICPMNRRWQFIFMC